MKTLLIMVGAAVYLFVVFCTVLYHISEEFQGNRKLSIVIGNKLISIIKRGLI